MPEQAPLKTHHMTYHWHRMVESKSDTPIRKAELQEIIRKRSAEGKEA